MRELDAGVITQAVQRLCIQANTRLPQDVKDTIAAARRAEDWSVAQDILDKIIENYSIGGDTPICQDTGMACVFLEIGQDVHINGPLTEAVNEGVRRGYTEGYLRKSVVRDPLDRVNTGDNTPAMVYTELVPGEQVKITVAPKGFGSENMSRIAMLKPSDGLGGVKQFILETVELLEKINALGIGPQGFGGRTTALAVQIETMPTHIAGLPCAVNINCHVARHVSEVL